MYKLICLQIDLKEKYVKTVAGNGKKGRDKYGGQLWTSQVLNTPWDVVYYKRENRTCHVSNQSQSNPVSTSQSPIRCLLIAMAGLHQIWALYLDKTNTSSCSSMKSK